MMAMRELKLPMLKHSLATSMKNSITWALCFFFAGFKTRRNIYFDSYLLNYSQRILFFSTYTSTNSQTIIASEHVHIAQSTQTHTQMSLKRSGVPHVHHRPLWWDTKTHSRLLKRVRKLDFPRQRPLMTFFIKLCQSPATERQYLSCKFLICLFFYSSRHQNYI